MHIFGKPFQSSSNQNSAKMKTTDAFTRGQNLISAILQKMLRIDKWQKEFISKIFLLSLSIGGRFNFQQMGREGEYNEQTYRNNFEKEFDFMEFNKRLIQEYCSEELIIAFDPSYIKKSGKATPGLGYFYSGVASMYKKGLEIGGIAAIDIKQNTGYHLEAVQTPSAKREDVGEGYSLVDHYADVIISRAAELTKISNTLVVDGYFPKRNFVIPIIEKTDFRIISRFRDDADLKYLYKGGKQKGRGRPRKFSGKVNTKKIDKRIFKKEYENTDVKIYSAIVYSVSLKIQVKVAYVEFKDKHGKIITYKMFFSTDTQMEGRIIFRYYKARYQIEFIYRDAKQYTGLEHSQARSENKLHFHFNVSLTSVSIGKIIQREGIDKAQRISYSLSDIKTELRNRNMIFTFFSMYGFDQTLKKITDVNSKEHKIYRDLLNFGKIAA